MDAGTYTCEKRVERDGVLIAFAGEVMTIEEAEQRGLIGDDAGKPARKSKADLVQEAEELGIELPKKATVDVIRGLIAEFEANAAPADDGSGDLGNGGAGDDDEEGAAE